MVPDGIRDILECWTMILRHVHLTTLRVQTALLHIDRLLHYRVGVSQDIGDGCCECLNEVVSVQ